MAKLMGGVVWEGKIFLLAYCVFQRSLIILGHTCFLVSADFGSPVLWLGGSVRVATLAGDLSWPIPTCVSMAALTLSRSGIWELPKWGPLQADFAIRLCSGGVVLSGRAIFFYWLTLRFRGH